MPPGEKERNIISDKLIIERTRKTLEKWLSVLHKKAAKKKTKAQFFKIVSETKGLKLLGMWHRRATVKNKKK